jgi:hypothetical protein
LVPFVRRDGVKHFLAKISDRANTMRQGQVGNGIRSMAGTFGGVSHTYEAQRPLQANLRRTA